MRLPVVEAVLLDRDGVVNENRVDHVKQWSEFNFLPGSQSSLRRLRSAGLKLGLVTNQAVVERKIVEQSQVEMIHSKMQAALALRSAEFHTIHYCPHKPESRCSCRKPEPGLAHAAIKALSVDPNKTCIIGDTYADAIMGLSAGCSYAIVIPSTRAPGSYDDVPPKFQDKVKHYSTLAKATDSIIESIKIFR